LDTLGDWPSQHKKQRLLLALLMPPNLALILEGRKPKLFTLKREKCHFCLPLLAIRKYTVVLGL